MSEYTPTTDEVIRSFSIPAHRVVERKDGESFADYLSRASIEGHKSQMESEAAARRWLAQVRAEARRDALREAADERDRYAGDADVVSRWLRALADKETP